MMNFIKKHFVFVLVQMVLILGMVAIMVYPKKPPIVVTVMNNDIGKLTIPISLYVSRVNKYGGIHGRELQVRYNDKPHGLTLDIGKNPVIIDTKGTKHKVYKEIELSHLNYRLSALRSDCVRTRNLLVRLDALKKIKGLDIIVESLENNKPIAQHHYYNCHIETKQRIKTGISMIHLSDIDFDDVLFTADFYLWLRWTGETNGYEDIEFVNTPKPSFLMRENHSDMTIKEVLSTDEGNKHYRRYRVTGRFKGLEKKNYILGEQNLPIRFRHSLFSTKEVVYIHDETDNANGVYNREVPSTVTQKEQSKYNVILDPNLQLHYTLQYSTFGDRVRMGYSSAIHSSEYTIRYGVESTPNSVRGLCVMANNIVSGINGYINLEYVGIYMIISLLLFNVLSLLHSSVLMKGYKRILLWLFRFGIMMLFLLSLEFLLSGGLFALKSTVWGIENLETVEFLLYSLKLTIQMIWWVAPAIYTASAIENFIFCPIEERTGTIIPKVLKFFVYSLIYVLAFIGILAFVVEIKASSLMATSGVFAILFAILSKVDVTNIVAGLGLSFSRVFKIGDWVKIGDEEGEVIELSARAVKLLTWDNAVVNLPNSTVGGSIIENRGENPYRDKIHLEIVPMDYRKAEFALLEGINRTIEISSKEEPFVAFLGQGDSAQIFEVYYFMDNPAKRGAIKHKVWENIWSACDKYGLEMSTPQREHFIFKGDS